MDGTNVVALILILIQIFFLQTSIANFEFKDDVEKLTENLIENLRVDPLLAGDSTLSASSKQFIDKHIGNYMKLVMAAEETEFSRSKRSLQRNETSFQDNYVDLKPYRIISTEESDDVVLFEQNSGWYAACLEGKPGQSRKLVIRKQQNDSFSVITEMEIWNGVRIATFPLESSTLILVAENGSKSQEFEHQANVFQLTLDEDLEIIQKINMSFSSDVSIWEDKRNIFMSVAQLMKEGPQARTFRVQVPFYKWRGRHFDVIQHVDAFGCTRISPFSIGDLHFVAMANSRSDDAGDGRTYSEILEYNVQTEKFEVFQKILTHACRDIKYFRIDKEREEEHFLIVANFHDGGEEGNESLPPSIIYKFVDNYFIPFQSLQLRGVSQWEPVMDDENVLLIATTLDGLKFFQYDSWRFVESRLAVPNNFRNEEVKAIRYYEYEDKDILVVTNTSGNKTTIGMYQVNFSSKNILKETHDYLLKWCRKNVEEIDDKDLTILGDTPRGDVIEEIDSASQTKSTDADQLTALLRTYESNIQTMEEEIEESFQFPKEHTIERNLTARNIILNASAVLDSVNFATVNNIQLENLLANTLNINEGFQIDSKVQFDFLRTEEPLFPRKINHFSVEQILHKSDNISLDNLTVKGNVIFKCNVAVKDKIANVSIKSDSLLLVDGDQIFHSFTASSVEARKLSATSLNNRSLSSNTAQEKTESQQKREDKPLVKNLDVLKVQNLAVGGFINDVDIPTLYKYALRKSGTQSIEKPYYFDTLVVENLATDDLSGKPVSAMIPTTAGKLYINKDVMFTKPFSVRNLSATEHLNSIPVVDGKLDVLLKNSPAMQSVTGMKSFENLKLLDAIRLRGKIRGKAFESMNPVVRVDDQEVNSDVSISGNVVVEEMIISGDILVPNGQQSLTRVVESAVKLSDPEMPVRLVFSQHINVDQLFAEEINDIDPSLWVVNGAKQTQIVRGWKQFDGDLEITGDTKVSRINDIDMGELEDNVLRKEGDQVISGKHYVKFVAAEKSISAKNTTFGPHPWHDVVTTAEDALLTGKIVFKQNFSVGKLTANNSQVDGLINTLNFTQIINDAVTMDSSFTIFGNKTFRNLTIDSLTVADLDSKQFLASSDRTFVLKSLNDLENLSVKNIRFGKELNNIDKSRLENIDARENDTLYVAGDQKIEKITVFGKVHVGSGRVNSVDLDDLELNTVKIDEPFHFDFVEFDDDVIVRDKIDLAGHVENLDLDNVFQNTGDDEPPNTIMDAKHFRDKVTVDGTIRINGKLNGVNVSELCDFTSDGRHAKKLVVEGDVHFAKGPHVLRFNGQEVEDLEKRIWFNDREAILEGDFDFQSDVTFRDDVNVKGLLNGIDIHHLLTNYLSKTKNQKVTAKMNFVHSVVFEDEVSTPELLLEGRINDINIKEFMQNVLLHRPQLFEDRLYFEEVTAKNMEGNYLVNKLNLETDVMRYDKPNMITGRKTFENLYIDVLTSERNITVQEVDVNYWLANAVLKTAGSFSVSGRKTFADVTVANGMSLIGYFNNMKLNKDTVLLKNTDQNITGLKVFSPSSPDGGLKFKSLKIRGLVNDVDVPDLINNQAHKHRDNTIKSPMNFHSNITTANLNFEKLYRGVNVTELLTNITNLGSLSDFGKNYGNLLEMSTTVEKSLKEQAYYLNYFKVLPYVPRVNEIFSSKCDNEENRIMTVTYENGSTLMNFLKWDEKQEIFVNTDEYSVNIEHYHPTYISQIELAGKDYVYIETEVAKSELEEENTKDHTHVGELIHFDQNTQFQSIKFLTKGTTFLTSFNIGTLNNHCLLFIDFHLDVNILCVGGDEEFFILQRIETEKPMMASVLSVRGRPYLVTARKDESRTAIWKINSKSEFEMYQTFSEGNPVGVSTIACKHGEFLAVAYGHLQNTKEYGKVIIRRFDKDNNDFVVHQMIKLKTPVQIEFAVLPTQELVLYVTTENPTEPFNVYIYEGISGFTKTVGASTIPNIINMNQFSLNNNHFVVVKHYYEIAVIRAVFKGGK